MSAIIIIVLIHTTHSPADVSAPRSIASSSSLDQIRGDFCLRNNSTHKDVRQAPRCRRQMYICVYCTHTNKSQPNAQMCLKNIDFY